MKKSILMVFIGFAGILIYLALRCVILIKQARKHYRGHEVTGELY